MRKIVLGRLFERDIFFWIIVVQYGHPIPTKAKGYSAFIACYSLGIFKYKVLKAILGHEYGAQHAHARLILRYHFKPPIFRPVCDNCCVYLRIF